jgi:hypothetical protein
MQEKLAKMEKKIVLLVSWGTLMRSDFQHEKHFSSFFLINSILHFFMECLQPVNMRT